MLSGMLSSPSDHAHFGPCGHGYEAIRTLLIPPRGAELWLLLPPQIPDLTCRSRLSVRRYQDVLFDKHRLTDVVFSAIQQGTESRTHRWEKKANSYMLNDVNFATRHQARNSLLTGLPCVTMTYLDRAASCMWKLPANRSAVAELMISISISSRFSLQI